MPTNQRDLIEVTGGEVYGLGGPDEFTWIGGSATISGGDAGEGYDSNVYGPAAQGGGGGDRLFIGGTLGAAIHLTGTEDGFARIGRQRLDFDGIERIHGTSGNDTFRAGAADLDRYGVSFYAGAGDDNIVGSRAGDLIDPGTGNDTVWAGAGDDFIQGSRGNDLIYGGDGNDNTRWGQGTAEGNLGTGGLAYGNDTVFGGAGSDVVNLWAHDWDGTGVAVRIDNIHADGAMAGTGSLSFTGTPETIRFQGMEQVWAHEGRDTLDASGAVVVGDAGVRVNLRWGSDVLLGSAGNDTLEGGDGADTITGGAGDDLLVGGGDYWNPDAGQDGASDLFIFRGQFGNDTIQGFDAGDRLDFGGAYTARDTAAGTLITADGGTVLLVGVHDFEV